MQSCHRIIVSDPRCGLGSRERHTYATSILNINSYDWILDKQRQSAGRVCCGRAQVQLVWHRSGSCQLVHLTIIRTGKSCSVLLCFPFHMSRTSFQIWWLKFTFLLLSFLEPSHPANRNLSSTIFNQTIGLQKVEYLFTWLCSTIFLAVPLPLALLPNSVSTNSHPRYCLEERWGTWQILRNLQSKIVFTLLREYTRRIIPSVIIFCATLLLR
jgi:hypothetical protein